MTSKDALLVVFIGLTIIFASISAIEYYQTHFQNGFYPSSGTRVYRVTFQQLPACGSNWASPWAVTLDNKTEAQPANAAIPSDGVGSTGNQSSTIVFAVPNGLYHWTIFPNDIIPASGVVSVNGSTALVKVQWALSCSLTTHATSSSNK